MKNILPVSGTYPEPCETSKIERFTKSTFAKHSLLDAWQDSEYASVCSVVTKKLLDKF